MRNICYKNVILEYFLAQSTLPENLIIHFLKFKIMAFNGSEGGEITLSQGAELTGKYRDYNPGQVKGHFFGKDILLQILSQEGCMGIRMYYGLTEDGDKELVLVGADASENDMTELVADLSLPCPGVCGAANSLNS